ncbi:MAG: UDP-glucose/GDP-mannose dehydrogenase family protein [Cyanobacteria bacterium]|nr:UDP-glucose/GDP-mannose dehydrogenase family protein [Cyanobacteriota bacterium]
MRVSVIGTGYVGLVTATCFAFLGHDVACLDINEKRIEDLKQGKVPIYEPHLEELLIACKAKNKYPIFSTDACEVISHGEFIFIAVGTPPQANGEPNLEYLKSAAETIGRYMQDGAIVINKSTVPVGSGNWVAMLVENGIALRATDASKHTSTLTKLDFSVASNPEFLREGSAIADTLYPDRIVVGSDNQEVANKLKGLYRVLSEQEFEALDFCPRPENFGKVEVISTDITSAEMIKYSANAFLASKISFANQMANICDLVGADVLEVMKGIGSDERIGHRFLNAGIGWGGSCFGKDVDALIKIAEEYNYNPEMLKATKKINYAQRDLVIKRLQEHLKIIKGKKIGLLGIAFKPNTDDLRDAPALDIAAALIKLGARVVATDPIAIENCKVQNPGFELSYVNNACELAEGLDALILVTEWQEYLDLDMKDLLARMNGNLFIDGRNQYSPSKMRELGFTYIGMGRA